MEKAEKVPAHQAMEQIKKLASAYVVARRELALANQEVQNAFDAMQDCEKTLGKYTKSTDVAWKNLDAYDAAFDRHVDAVANLETAVEKHAVARQDYVNAVGIEGKRFRREMNDSIESLEKARAG